MMSGSVKTHAGGDTTRKQSSCGCKSDESEQQQVISTFGGTEIQVQGHDVQSSCRCKGLVQ